MVIIFTHSLITSLSYLDLSCYTLHFVFDFHFEVIESKWIALERIILVQVDSGFTIVVCRTNSVSPTGALG